MAKAKMTNPSPKILNTFELLKSGKSVNFEDMVAALEVKPVTAMVFICALRKDFGAEIDTERDGRKVISYKLNNAAEIAPSMVLKTKASKPVKKVKAPVVKTRKTVTRVSSSSDVPTIDSEFDVSEVSDAELADIKNQLGLA
jgi:hypothetical protein